MKKGMANKAIGRNPYKVEMDRSGCSKCGAGKLWMVVGPDGFSQSVLYGDRDEADHQAWILSKAYNLGLAAETVGAKK